MSFCKVKRTVYIPLELTDLIEKRKREEHHRTTSEYLLSVLLWDLITRPFHTLTRRLLNDPPDEQAKFFKQIVLDFDKRAAARGEWMTKVIREIIEQNGIDVSRAKD